MPVSSIGEILVNAVGLTTSDSLAAVVEAATAPPLKVLGGVVVPRRLRGRLIENLDNAATDMAGRLGGKLGARARRTTCRRRSGE